MQLPRGGVREGAKLGGKSHPQCKIKIKTADFLAAKDFILESGTQV